MSVESKKMLGLLIKSAGIAVFLASITLLANGDYPKFGIYESKPTVLFVIYLLINLVVFGAIIFGNALENTKISDES